MMRDNIEYIGHRRHAGQITFQPWPPSLPNAPHRYVVSFEYLEDCTGIVWLKGDIESFATHAEAVARIHEWGGPDILIQDDTGGQP